MLYSVFILFSCLILTLCFIDDKGHYSDKLLFLLMFPLMAFSSENADRAAYVMMYEQIGNLSQIGVTDPAFGLLMFIGRSLNLKYDEFLILLALIGLVFVFITFKKLSICPSIVLSIYFCLLFPTFTIQIRAFIAETILYIMIVRIINEEKLDFFSFFILFALSIMFHSTSFFFILILFAVYIKRSDLFIIVMALMVLTIPFVPLFLGYIPIPMLQSKIQYYFGYRTSISKAAIFLVISYFIITFFIYIVFRNTKKQMWKRRLEKLIRLHVIGLIACIMIIVFNSNYYRMIRVVIVIDSIILGNYCFSIHTPAAFERTVLAGVFVPTFVVYEIMTGTLFMLLINNSVLSKFLELS